MYGGHPLNNKFIQHFDKRRQEAVSCNNLSLAKGFSQIVCSIRRYPVPIYNRSHAEGIMGIGPTHLTEFEALFVQMNASCEDGAWREFMREQVETQCERMGGFPFIGDIENDQRPDEKKVKRYIPSIGSPGWAVVIVLHLNNEVCLSMASILDKILPFVAKYPKTSKVNETVLKKLINEGIVKTSGVLCSAQYSLTLKYGMELASNLWQRSLRTENLLSALSRCRAAYELIMIVDSRESSLVRVLQAFGVLVEVRSLAVGDVVWVWRRGEKSDEYMSGFCVERKTMDDLSSSIKDGRYDEQRSRLGRSPGTEKVVYIIEGEYGPMMLPEISLNSAIRHTEMMAGFAVVRTSNVEETATTLMEMHRLILRRLPSGDDNEDAVTFREFNAETQKTKCLTVSQLSAMMLRAIPGIGTEAIVALDEYLKRIGKGGITLKNVSDILIDSNLSETIKSVLGTKRIPINATALSVLKYQLSL